jgi:hypothetical protein
MTDAARLAIAVAKLDPQPRQAYWRSLSFCIADAVFSIGAHYDKVVTKVVHRIAADFSVISAAVPTAQLLGDDPVPLDDFLARYPDADALTAVVRNRQRTSTRNGIRKTDACLQYAAILRDYGAPTLSQARDLFADPDRMAVVEAVLKKVPGEGTAGIRRGYLWMLIGADDLIKPDRMVLRWLRNHGSDADADADAATARSLITAVATHLTKTSGRRVTPWGIDHAIWAAARTG